MALSDSMFLFEITVEDFVSHVRCREFIIKTQFADLFYIVLKDANKSENVLSKNFLGTHYKRKTRLKRPRSLFSKAQQEIKIQTGQSVVSADSIDYLIATMKKYPMELSLWGNYLPENKVASTNITWNTIFIDYINKINAGRDPQPVSMKGEYNIFDEYTSRRMAVIKLNIKLSYLAGGIFNDLKSLHFKKTNSVICSDTNSKTHTMLNTILERPCNFPEDVGVMKTIYHRSYKKSKDVPSKTKAVLRKLIARTDNIIKENITIDINGHTEPVNKKANVSIVSLVKSDTDTDKTKHIDLVKSKSCSSMTKEQLNILNYIIGGSTGPSANQVYCVGYFTVENDLINSPKSSKSSKSASPTLSNEGSDKSAETSRKSGSAILSKQASSNNVELCGKPSIGANFKLKLCDEECLNERIETGFCNLSMCSLDVPKDTDLVKCKDITCERKTFRKLPNPPDDKILLDLTHLNDECCVLKSKVGDKTRNEDIGEKDNTMEKVEEVVGGVRAKLKFGEDPCYCECECRFGFTKKTTYCSICKGFESLGEDVNERQLIDMPFPCPAYHKLMDKAKYKPSTTGSDNKKLAKKKSTSVKSIESEKDTKKGKKKKKDNKFKFNYGYTAPHIGHSRCAIPCTGTLNQVPKKMGWLWTADNVPGMKFRPLWKPGAVNKHVLRLLKIARNPNEAFAKKKRKRDTGKGKRPLKRPLLVVHKKDGEFTVTMETMKTYGKPRNINQVPYEDKPPLTYTIGRTDEENRERHKKKERAKRRLERSQREFIQSAFQDMCEEICLKTYQQALGILPDTEKPDCTCYPAQPGPDRTDLDYSCSCSDDSNLISSDTDSDEWIVEFTPPTAKFDQSYKGKKIQYNDSSVQYTYLDYRVKLLDRFGNPVSRFFKDANGKEQCSDLGGFWGPGKKWLQINVDGYIAPDGRWAPNIFYGPDGEHIDGESGKFQATDGTWLVVGIDGYVDSQGKWQYYTRKTGRAIPKRRSSPVPAKRGAGDRKEVPLTSKKSLGTWSCFGDVSPRQLSKMGIMGHGHDRKLLLDTLKKLIAQGEDLKIPQSPSVPHSQQKKGRVKRLGVSSILKDYEHQRKCVHAPPSDKGVVAIDAHGNKTYFILKTSKNRRPEERIATLTDQGISISSFHVPCLHSFINREIMKKEQYDRLVALAKKHEQSHQPGNEHLGNRNYQVDHGYRNIIV